MEISFLRPFEQVLIWGKPGKVGTHSQISPLCCRFHNHLNKMIKKSCTQFGHPGKCNYYSTGVQIINCNCTLSDDSVLSESTRFFNLILCASQWNLFRQSISQSDYVSQIRLGLVRIISLSSWWLQQAFEDPIGIFITIWHWNMLWFQWHQSVP